MRGDDLWMHRNLSLAYITVAYSFEGVADVVYGGL